MGGWWHSLGIHVSVPCLRLSQALAVQLLAHP